MAQVKSGFDINEELVLVRNSGNVLGQTLAAHLFNALDKISVALQTVGQNIGVPPSGKMPAPPAVQQLTVKTAANDGSVHAVVSDNNEISKNLHYFVEYATNTSFFGSHVVHLGVSRTMHPIVLPAFDDNGNPQKFYFRAYSQYPGGDPGPKVNFGGLNPTAVAPNGTTQMTLLPSTGSGTAQNTGQESGLGFGRSLIRPRS